jgi:hypothetical protein
MSCVNANCTILSVGKLTIPNKTTYSLTFYPTIFLLEINTEATPQHHDNT